MVAHLSLPWRYRLVTGLVVVAATCFGSGPVACGSSETAEAVTVEAPHWLEHDFAPVLERFVDEDDLAFETVAEALGYDLFVADVSDGGRGSAGGEDKPSENASEDGVSSQGTSMWATVTHETGPLQSWIALREREVGGMSPTRQLRLVLEGQEGASRDELVRLSETVAEALATRFRRHRRELVPPGAPEGTRLRQSLAPPTRVWDLAGDATVTLQPATYRPRIMLEVYRYSQHPDGTVMRRDEYETPDEEPAADAPSVLDELEGANDWRDTLRGEREDRDETDAFDAAALIVPGLGKPASEVHEQIRKVHLAYARAAAQGFDGGMLRNGRMTLDGREWLVVAADEAGVEFRGGGNARRELAWEELAPKSVLAGYRDLRSVTPGQIAGIARYAYAVDLPHEGDRTLKRLLDRGALESQQVFALLAELRGTTVPDGGFLWERDLKGTRRFITPDEKRAAEHLARVDMLVARLERHARRGERGAQAVEELVEELQGLGSESQLRARKALERRWEEALSWLEEAQLDAHPWRLRLYDRLGDARRDALNAIRDTASYRKEEETVHGQDEVDENVEAVRVLWKAPFDVVAEEDPTLVQRTESARWFAQLLRAVGAPREVERRTEDVLEALEQRVNAEVNLRDNPPTSAARARAEYVKNTRQRNDEDRVATEIERGFAHELNDYRHMLGLEPLALHGALTQASRVHSEFMDETGRFGHNLSGHPHGESPADRAATFDYDGALGENIAMHSHGFTPASALRAWYGSPDHHRNMLLENWTRIGVGVSENDRYWTTKFGR